MLIVYNFDIAYIPNSSKIHMNYFVEITIITFLPHMHVRRVAHLSKHLTTIAAPVIKLTIAVASLILTNRA